MLKVNCCGYRPPPRGRREGLRGELDLNTSTRTMSPSQPSTGTDNPAQERENP